MHNQFCKKCGQANFPNATVCTKCGTGLAGGQPNQSAYGSSMEEPPPTILPNRGNSGQKKKGGSSKTVWIIGGIAVVLILGLGILAVVAGIGGYFYLSSQQGTEANREYPAPRTDDGSTTNTPDDGSKNDGDQTGTLTDSQLEEFIRSSRSQVGNYRLDNVKAFEGSDFSGRTAGITALYINGSKRVVHSIAMFKTYSEATDDFSRYKRGIRGMKGSVVRSSEKDRIIFSHKGSVFLTFCNTEGGCHELISKDGPTILDYYNSYFGKS